MAELERVNANIAGSVGLLDPLLDLVGPGQVPRVVGPEQVEALDRYQPYAFVEHRIGLARKHVDVVPERGQLTGEVSGVDTLAARMGVAPIGEPGDTKGTAAVRSS